ncbi:MAG: hypothetical protein AAFR35_08460 [Pseudomonadota bacterium]
MSDTPDETPEAKPKRGGGPLSGMTQFLFGLPAALLLSGFLFERFGVLSLIEQAALQFRRISADFWEAVLGFLQFRFAYDPDILSIYTILIGSSVGLIFQKSEVDDQKQVMWYGLAFVSMLLIVTGYDGWGFVVTLATFFGGVLLTVLIYIILVLPFVLIGAAVSGWEGAMQVSRVLKGAATILVLAFLLGLDVVGWLERAPLPAFISGPLIGLLGLYTFETLGRVLLAFLTLIVIFVAPFSRMPVVIVAWVGVFFLADWFDHTILPVLETYLDAGEGSV